MELYHITDVISEASAGGFSSTSLFTRFYPPVGKTHPVIYLLYTGTNSLATRYLETVSYYVCLCALTHPITQFLFGKTLHTEGVPDYVN
jgi:hypothetical protein